MKVQIYTEDDPGYTAGIVYRGVRLVELTDDQGKTLLVSTDGTQFVLTVGDAVPDSNAFLSCICRE